MALINCSECGKVVSDKAASCPNCGNPINIQGTVFREAIENREHLLCPICLSRELHAEKSGFSGGKALVGAVLAGGMGLLAGSIGSNDIQITCLKCGNRFKAGEAVIEKIKNESDKLIDDKLIEFITKGEMISAVKFYKDTKKVGLKESKKYVDDLMKLKGITPSKSGGCAGVLLLLFLVLSIVMLIYLLSSCINQERNSLQKLTDEKIMVLRQL
ncbi:MAG: hypothetical protein LBE56_09405 [Tannerella sp.]|jgi:RNA polymerase subunit RPABC4/transcription elongation factor Spt4|nr:hypothetical protein [Tannerella sp.]